MEFVEANGKSGGLLCLWDPSVFRSTAVVKNSHYLWIKGHTFGNNQEINIFNVYAPHRASEKKVLWSNLKEIIEAGSERRNSGFNRASADDFNEFIESVGLVEYSMRGRSFTFLAPNSNKLSKIDRVLEGFDSMVVAAAGSFVGGGARADANLTLKLKHIRNVIKRWIKIESSKAKEDMIREKEELEYLDKLSETRDLNEEERWVREECSKNIRERDLAAALDLKQKSRCRRALEGDENSAFFFPQAYQ
ncbi:uncharacterized protein LOC118490529 [Helianthus annuus]|uniref:uncharacterized protein LOC118490529 n=1 Tax=Helianthus annuus TaxID=4232 RepID=UPI001652C2F7|nr:uncharacterized protein LOC118490529 [Helianthus annuus]